MSLQALPFPPTMPTRASLLSPDVVALFRRKRAIEQQSEAALVERNRKATESL